MPSYYFTNKIIFGTIIGYLTYIIFRKQKWHTRALLFSGVVSVLLQIKYYLEGYPKDFVFLFLGIHFVILVVISLFVFKIAENYKKYLL